jgi:hypothetical protein
MRLLYSAYFKYIGEEDRPNPFRNLAFKDRQSTDVPPFEDTASMMESDWIKPFVAIARQKCVDECMRMWHEAFDALRPDHV